MNSFAIIGDTASGLTKELRERFGIEDYVRGHITFPDGQDHVADLDWEEIDPDTYYKSMLKGSNIYKTGVPGLQAIEDTAGQFMAAGRDVLAITLSSGMSATYSTYLTAKKELEEKYPGRRFEVVDSLRFSTPIILMNMKASEMRAAGFSLDETVKWLTENRNRVRQMGPMNDLKFLARTGRITNFKAFFGSLVGVNALGDFAPNGVSQVLANIKGSAKALKATVEYVKRTIVDPEDQVIFIGHTYRAQEAADLRDMIAKDINPKEIVVTRVDMSCGANVGPGMVGAYYFGKDGSEGLKEETAIMAEIVESLK